MLTLRIPTGWGISGGPQRSDRLYTSVQGSTRQLVTSPSVTYGSACANASAAARSPNTIAAPCGGSPSGPASRIRPSSFAGADGRQVIGAERLAALEDVPDVLVEEDLPSLGLGHVANTLRFRRATLPIVADIEKRGGYTPRRVRERRAYQLVVTGGVASAVFVVSLVLSIAGVLGATLPVISLIVAVICLFLFRRIVGGS